MGVKLYYTTVTGSRTVKSQQAEVMRILESKSIQYELVDISMDGELREEMRSKAGNPTAAPPQLFNEDQYCGLRIDGEGENRLLLHSYGAILRSTWMKESNYEMFSEAVEADAVKQFLKLA